MGVPVKIYNYYIHWLCLKGIDIPHIVGAVANMKQVGGEGGGRGEGRGEAKPLLSYYTWNELC